MLERRTSHAGRVHVGHLWWQYPGARVPRPSDSECDGICPALAANALEPERLPMKGWSAPVGHQQLGCRSGPEWPICGLGHPGCPGWPKNIPAPLVAQWAAALLLHDRERANLPARGAFAWSWQAAAAPRRSAHFGFLMFKNKMLANFQIWNSHIFSKILGQ